MKPKPKRQRNKGCAYTGLVGAKMRIPVHRKPTRVIARAPVGLLDGPLAGKTLRMDAFAGATTLPFTLYGKTGRYVAGTWEPAA